MFNTLHVRGTATIASIQPYTIVRINNGGSHLVCQVKPYTRYFCVLSQQRSFEMTIFIHENILKIHFNIHLSTSPTQKPRIPTYPLVLIVYT